MYELARYEESEKLIRHAIHLVSEESLYLCYSQLGHLYKNRGDYEKAEQYYRKTIEQRPDYANSHIYLGAVLALTGDLDAAAKAHQQGTTCTKGCIDEAYLNLGFIRRAQERYAEALECFQKTLELDPDDEKAVVAKRDMEKVLEYLA